MLMTQPEHVRAFMLVGSVAALVATVSQYLLAPETEDQLKPGVVETLLVPLEGADKTGAANSAGAVVVKENCEDNCPWWVGLTYTLSLHAALTILVLLARAVEGV